MYKTDDTFIQPPNITENQGHVEKGFLLNNQILISGWYHAVTNSQLLVIYKNKVIRILDNNNVSKKHNFQILINPDEVTDQQIYQLKYYVCDNDNNITHLKKGPQYFLDRFNINTFEDYKKNVQLTKKRIKHDESLIYLCQKAIKKFADNPIVQASATCVIGYRLIKITPQDKITPKIINILESITNTANNIIEHFAGDNSPNGCRWPISLLMLNGFIAMFLKRNDLSLYYFNEICTRQDVVQKWPICCYNVMTGFFISGYLQHIAGNKDEAYKLWQKGCANVGTFTAYHNEFNIGTLTELSFAVRTGLQCAEASEICLNAPNFYDSFIKTMDFTCIKQPFERIITGKVTATNMGIMVNCGSLKSVVIVYGIALAREVFICTK